MRNAWVMCSRFSACDAAAATSAATAAAHGFAEVVKHIAGRWQHMPIPFVPILGGVRMCVSPPALLLMQATLNSVLRLCCLLLSAWFWPSIGHRDPADLLWRYLGGC